MDFVVAEHKPLPFLHVLKVLHWNTNVKTPYEGPQNGKKMIVVNPIVLDLRHPATQKNNQPVPQSEFSSESEAAFQQLSEEPQIQN